MKDIHSLLASVLDFPQNFEKNWDAFDECINANKTLNQPVMLILIGWDIFIKEHPSEMLP